MWIENGNILSSGNFLSPGDRSNQIDQQALEVEYFQAGWQSSFQLAGLFRLQEDFTG